MKAIRHVLIMLFALYSLPSYSDEISIGIGLPNDNIGIDVSEYPELVVVPGYPVYYAPQLDANYFFYDGEYWIYDDDTWYQSAWFDGPWWPVDPEFVPVFILRIPVLYYRLPPEYFRGWRADAPPHWGEHWGHEWERHKRGWDKWNHTAHRNPAPLPDYQREYTGDRYPRQEEQQHELHQKYYRYQPRDPIAQQHRHEQLLQGGAVQQEIKRMPHERGPAQQDNQHANTRQQGNASTRTPSPQREGIRPQGSTQEAQRQGRVAVQEHKQPSQPVAARQEQQRSQDRETRQQDNNVERAQKHEQRQEQERGRDR